MQQNLIRHRLFANTRTYDFNSSQFYVQYCLNQTVQGVYMSVEMSRLYDGVRLKSIHFSWLGPELLVCCLAHRGPTGVFLLLRVSVKYSAPRDLHRQASY